ncbi:MAG: hypothetical protein E6L02_05920 [Thaumarchaeota archaeon]|nr:MAG: hypothetical protein E6L02_05920 [Nitrososphaerota archaeon]
MEITTLTEIPNKISEFPLEFIKPAVVAPKQTEIQSMKEIPKPVLEIPNLAIETSHSEHLQAMIEKKNEGALKTRTSRGRIIDIG